MPLDRCLFAVQLASEDDRPAAERRVGELRSLYARLGAADVATEYVAEARCLLGVIRMDGPASMSGTASWGAELPQRLADGRALVECTRAELRSLPGSLAAMGASGGRVVLVTGPAGAQALYRAEGRGSSAWSSHALAASWLATGAAVLDPEAVAELVCWEFAGGSRTLLRHTHAVGPATRIALDASGAREQAYLTLGERWEPLPPREANELAGRRLLEWLSRALGEAPEPVLGLTGGADSRTVAVALRELGIDARALTYVSDEGAARDAACAAQVAARLGMRHELAAVEQARAGLPAVRAESLWADGTAPAAVGSVRWPEPLSHWVAGVGAEVGRAFYYRWLGRPPAQAGERGLERVLFADMDLDLGGADPEIRQRLRGTVRGWLAEAAGSGHTGLSVLDVVYGEQRVRRWARAMTPRMAAHFVPAFATQPVMQALASLPLQDRLEDGFAQSFVHARTPDLAPTAPTPARRWPPPLACRRAMFAARRVRRALGLPPLGRAEHTPWHRRPEWGEHREVVDWLADAVLAAPLIEEAMGAGWQRETRANFLRGEPHAAYLASWAAGPVALAEALAEPVAG